MKMDGESNAFRRSKYVRHTLLADHDYACHTYLSATLAVLIASNFYTRIGTALYMIAQTRTVLVPKPFINPAANSSISVQLCLVERPEGNRYDYILDSLHEGAVDEAIVEERRAPKANFEWESETVLC